MEKSKFKKILLILGFLAFVILMAYFIWTSFFKKQITTETPIIGTSTSTGSGLPISPEGSGQIIDSTGTSSIITSPDTPQIQPGPTTQTEGIEVSNTAIGGITKTTTLVSSGTSNPIISRDGNSVQFYNQVDGKFYLVNDKGDLIPLSNKVFHNVQDVEWAPNKTKAVLEYPDGNKIVYDFSTEKQVTLPKHWEDFSFSTDSNKLISKSLGTDPDNRWLIVSNSDGSQSKAIEFIGENDKNVIPSWSPNNQSIAMYTEGVDFNRREVFFVGLNDENFKSTVVEGWNFSGSWSKTGDKLLYSVSSPKNELKPNLWIVNAQGDNIGVNRTDLNIETWVEKCTFANDTEVYCAVPTSLPKGSGLNSELAKNSNDNLYKINIQTGQKELIAIPDKAYNVSSITVSQDQKTLFFTDNVNGGIHKVQLQ
ncbi:MAG TPA: hypothetical protein PK142_00930 [bacterium]|nr:hypothetical protein [bacterium]